MGADADVVEQFWALAKTAERIDSEQLETDVEPAFEAVLSHVLSHPEARPAFVEALLSMAADPNKGPPELIEFCMHALRWSELRDAFAAWLDREDSERVRHVLRKVVAAFDANWRDAAFYSRFSTATP